MRRSLICYAAFALTALSALVGGSLSLQEFGSSLVFLENLRFGNILRSFSVLMLITPIIIGIRIRMSTWYILASTVGLYFSYAWLGAFKSLDAGLLNVPLNIFLGIGPVRSGPSVLGALSFCPA